MFLLLSTPAEIVQKCQNLNTSGEWDGNLIVNSGEVRLSNNEAYAMYDTGSNARALIKLTSGNEVEVGDGVVAGDLNIDKVNNASYYFVFRKGSTDIAKIDNSGNYSSDGGTTFVDISATIPQYLKNTQTDATEYSNSTSHPSYSDLKVFTALAPSDTDNILLGVKLDVDVKSQNGNTTRVRVEISDGTTTNTYCAITETSTSYVTHNEYARITDFMCESSYTIKVEGNSDSGVGVYIENTTVTVLYIEKAQED